MKKHILYSLLIVFIMGGCEKDLSPEVYNRLSTSNFPKTEEDFNVLVNGIYGEFRNNHAWYRYSINPESRFILGLTGTEEYHAAWDWCQRPQMNFDFNPGYSLFTMFYSEMVPAVTKATAVIKQLSDAGLENQELINRFIAEVRACRALWLYDLAGIYGPPPVVLDPEAALNPTKEYFPPRLSEEELFTFLEDDLLNAIDILPIAYSASNDYGRWTKGAASTLLLKLYMRHKRFQEAIDISAQIMTMGYTLEPDYTKIWNINNEKNPELIFVLPCLSQVDPNTNLMRAHVVPAGFISPDGNPVVSFGGYSVPWSTYDQFDTSDIRRKTLVKDFYVSTGGVVKLIDGRKTGRLRNGALPLKYSEDPSSDGLFTGNDLVIMRYADVLMLRAEALNEINGPVQESIDLINMIRNRAFANDPAKEVTLSDFGNKESLRDYILQERLFEFCFEGERREDLIRHGKYIEFAHARGITAAQPHHVRFPLPTSAIIEGEGHIKQNDGY
ncbi:MAG: RagB/SusD family nutrient uptake outer membrane protein [Bacteroidales bacterium]|nr:RagB/SusD family nutrient uptake outer membrane protein [Bacteroidales bacterium]